MALYGGTITDVLIQAPVAANTIVAVFDAPVGGARVESSLLDVDGSPLSGGIVSSDGHGVIRPFSDPLDRDLWVVPIVNGLEAGPRQQLLPADGRAETADLRGQLAVIEATLPDLAPAATVELLSGRLDEVEPLAGTAVQPATLTAALASKANSASVTAALATKADATALAAETAAREAAIEARRLADMSTYGLRNIGQFSRLGRLGGEKAIYSLLELDADGAALASTNPNGAVWSLSDYGRTRSLVQLNAGGAATARGLARFPGTSIVVVGTDNEGKLSRSTNGGATWTNSASSLQVAPSLANPKINCTLVASDGSLLCGLYHNSAGGIRLVRSTDQGVSISGGIAVGTAKGVNEMLDLPHLGKVLLAVQNSGDGLSEWYTVNYDLTGLTRVTTGLNLTPGEFGHALCMTDDGRPLGGSYGASGDSHLYLFNADATAAEVVCTDPAEGFFSLLNCGDGLVVAGTGVVGASNGECKTMLSRDDGRSFADHQTFRGTGNTHVTTLLKQADGSVLAGTEGVVGAGGDLWTTGIPVSLPTTPGDRILLGYNRSGAAKPAGTPVILGGIATTAPGGGAHFSFYGAASDGAAGTIGVLLDATPNQGVGRVMTSGVTTVNVQSGSYTPGDRLRTFPDGLTAVADNAAGNTKLGTVLVGGSAVTTVSALINVERY